MKKLLKYMKEYIKESILAPFFKMTEAGLELIVPIVMAAIIDNGIVKNDVDYIIHMVIILVGIAIVGLACSITAQYFAAKAAVGFTARLRHETFSHITKLSFTEFDNIGTGTMITRMTSDMNQVQNGVNLTLRLFLRSPFVVLGAMIMAFTIDTKSAIIFAVIIPLLAAVVFWIMLSCIPQYKNAQGALDKVLSRTRQNLTGVRVIRAFRKEREEEKSFSEENEAFTTVSKKVGRLSSLMNPLTYVMINGGIIVLIYVGAIRVQSGLLSTGAVVALYNYMSQILIELIKLANLIITMTKAAACANRISDLLEIKSSMPAADKPAELDFDKNAVEFKDVSVRYSGGAEEAVSSVSFCVKSGCTIGIIGGTGSGKSTVVNLIPRFYDAQKGSVKVFGKDVKELDLEALRSNIGIAMQNAVLFSGTVRDNLLWGNGNASDEEILSALEIAQMRDFVEEKPEGLSYFIEQGGKNLSGGQRQRLAIARALVRKPRILILDDSASALDYKTDMLLRRAISSLDYSPTVFIVSQRASSVMLADEIIVLDDGRIAGRGSHEELLEKCGLYKEIYDTQFAEVDDEK